jgi:hypothetical protein
MSIRKTSDAELINCGGHTLPSWIYTRRFKGESFNTVSPKEEKKEIEKNIKGISDSEKLKKAIALLQEWICDLQYLEEDSIIDVKNQGDYVVQDYMRLQKKTLDFLEKE